VTGEDIKKSDKMLKVIKGRILNELGSEPLSFCAFDFVPGV
jgi:hypothetical protein